MRAVLLMVLATGLFAAMGVTVKWSAAHYGTAEIVFYRGLIGASMMVLLARLQGIRLATSVPAKHAARSVSGVSALMLWFYAIGQLPLATAVTLNYMSSVWMAVFILLMGWLVRRGWAPEGSGTYRRGTDPRLVLAVLFGFAGVVMVLRPALGQGSWWGPGAGLLSGMLSASAYLQVSALGRAGEPEPRVVFYFSLAGLVAGATGVWLTGSWHAHTWPTLWPLLATGVLATAAQLLMTRAYALGRTLVNASLQYLGIVYAAGLGVWLFGDHLDLWSAAGMAMIMASGLAATLLRPTTGR